MRTYDLIQPKSNDLDRNLIIRAIGAHTLWLYVPDKARKRPHSWQWTIEPNFAKFNEFNVLATKPCNCPTNEYDEIYYLLSSHHPVKCQSYLAVQSVLVKSPSLAAKGLFIVQNSLTWTFRLTYTSRLVFNAPSVPDLASLTVFGRCQAQKNPHMSYNSLGTRYGRVAGLSDDSYRISRIISHLLGLHKIDDTRMSGCKRF